MHKTNPKVDEHLRKAERWQPELKKLRTILLDGPLVEEWKWNKPCYTIQGSNVVVVLSLKESCTLLFCKGALLKDAAGILTQPTENTQGARQLRFSSLRQIDETEPLLRAYLHEAVEAEKAGLEVVYKPTSEYKVPVEFQQELAQSPALQHAFDTLTPGRQRGYLLYFSAPKQSKTRTARVAKCRPQILGGRGLND